MFKIREYQPTDKNFIYNSWLKSFQKSSGITDKDLFFLNHHKLLDKLIPECKILIACDENEDDTILGWLCYEDLSVTIIHYAFTKELFRKVNIFNSLVAYIECTNPLIYTHKTIQSENLLKTKKKFYNPYKAYLR